MEKKLTEIREQIDAIDNQMLTLLNKRMELVREVGHLKRSNNAVIYRPEREKAILDRLNKINTGPIAPQAIEAIFLEIFAASRHFELPERVAYLGPEGSFTHQAAESRFGALSDYVSLSTIQSVFESVETGRVRFGVIPIENNREGSVHETIDLLISSDVRIVAEVPLDIHFTFASMEDRLSHIKKIYSKDIAFRQCKRFLDEYFGDSNVELIPVESTSKAAKLASEEPYAAAICARVAATIHKLPLLFENIEDSVYNRTRFLIISKDFNNQKAAGSKTSLIVKLDNDTKAGTLASFLNDFNEAGVNLTKIESRPAKQKGKFNYWFLIDFDGHCEDEAIAPILAKHGDHIKLLGSYVKLV
ncbi:prephenate dehydratase [Rhodoflexus caldus]|uniref:prephenate dehydratase n=1 Tax=Rhodoflexus caldus TaxID=2891236 RepID=UPI00202A7B51|nr:prephenate dehydratase [Rhodoflexus caldus]